MELTTSAGTGRFYSNATCTTDLLDYDHDRGRQFTGVLLQGHRSRNADGHGRSERYDFDGADHPARDHHRRLHGTRGCEHRTKRCGRHECWRGADVDGDGDHRHANPALLLDEGRCGDRGAPDSATYTLNAVALIDAGTYAVVVSNGCSAGVTSGNAAVVSVNRVATSLTIAAGDGTYGGSTASVLTATLTSGGNGVGGRTITFAFNGTSVGHRDDERLGVATLAAVSSLAGINAGTYPTGVSASFTQDATYAGQTAANSLTVARQLSVKADDKSKTYDGAAFSPFTATISGFVAGETETVLRSSGALTGAAAFAAAATTAVNASAIPISDYAAVGTLSRRTTPSRS